MTDIDSLLLKLEKLKNQTAVVDHGIFGSMASYVAYELQLISTHYFFHNMSEALLEAKDDKWTMLLSDITYSDLYLVNMGIDNHIQKNFLKPLAPWAMETTIHTLFSHFSEKPKYQNYFARCVWPALMGYFTSKEVIIKGIDIMSIALDLYPDSTLAIDMVAFFMTYATDFQHVFSNVIYDCFASSNFTLDEVVQQICPCLQHSVIFLPETTCVFLASLELGTFQKVVRRMINIVVSSHWRYLPQYAGTTTLFDEHGKSSFLNSIESADFSALRETLINNTNHADSFALATFRPSKVIRLYSFFDLALYDAIFFGAPEPTNFSACFKLNNPRYSSHGLFSSVNQSTPPTPQGEWAPRYLRLKQAAARVGDEIENLVTGKDEFAQFVYQTRITELEYYRDQYQMASTQLPLNRVVQQQLAYSESIFFASSIAYASAFMKANAGVDHNELLQNIRKNTLGFLKQSKTVTEDDIEALEYCFFGDKDPLTKITYRSGFISTGCISDDSVHNRAVCRFVLFAHYGLRVMTFSRGPKIDVTLSTKDIHQSIDLLLPKDKLTLTLRKVKALFSKLAMEGVEDGYRAIMISQIVNLLSGYFFQICQGKPEAESAAFARLVTAEGIVPLNSHEQTVPLMGSVALLSESRDLPYAFRKSLNRFLVWIGAN